MEKLFRITSFVRTEIFGAVREVIIFASLQLALLEEAHTQKLVSL